MKKLKKDQILSSEKRSALIVKNNSFMTSLTGFLVKHQFKVKFVLVGIWNTIFGYFIFVALDTLFSYLFETRYLAYMSAMAFSNIITIVNAFIFHKFITFKSMVRGKAMIMEYFRFSTIYLFTFGISLALLPFFVEILNFNTKISGAFVVLISAVISYLGHSNFSFKNRALKKKYIKLSF
jgi:putative flippase GtrA